MEEATEPAPSLVDLLQETAEVRHVAKPDLASSAATSYLDQLLSLPLKSLLSEASVISAEAASVENELTNLCYREYPTFISVHHCSSAVTAAFDDFSGSLGRLLDAVPALEDECRTFVTATKGVQNARARAALVQEHQDKLFDLLEIPQLMNTCVRNGYYQEVLELSAHTDSLVKRFPNVELVQDVAKEVESVLQLMLAQLLTLLREPIKLPALVKTVGFLRRLRSVDETELGLVFLVSRLSNFRAHLVSLERDRADPNRYVRKYVDLFREHVFDIISQFTAIFLESSGSTVAASQLASFVGQCVNDLVAVVAENVPKMTNDAASLSSILVQLGYCSLAFARVGLDFAPLVTEPFNDAVLTAFSQTIQTASTSFSSTLSQAAKSVGSPAQVLIAPEHLAPLLAADSPLGFVRWGGSYEILPTDLARFPSLAMLVNGHLTALNSLRLLAPIHLFPKLVAVQSSSLLACTHSIAQYVRQTVALSDPLSSPGASSPTHTRRTSSGRIELLRRNSEGQLTPEARTAKRRETQWVCVAFADTWVRVVYPLLVDALDRGIFDSAEKRSAHDLQQALDSVVSWIDDQLGKPQANGPTEKSPNGTLGGAAKAILEEEPVTAEPEEVKVEDDANDVAEESGEVNDEQPMETEERVPEEPVQDGDKPPSPTPSPPAEPPAPLDPAPLVEPAAVETTAMPEASPVEAPAEAASQPDEAKPPQETEQAVETEQPAGTEAVVAEEHVQTAPAEAEADDATEQPSVPAAEVAPPVAAAPAAEAADAPAETSPEPETAADAPAETSPELETAATTAAAAAPATEPPPRASPEPVTASPAPEAVPAATADALTPPSPPAPAPKVADGPIPTFVSESAPEPTSDPTPVSESTAMPAAEPSPAEPSSASSPSPASQANAAEATLAGEGETQRSATGPSVVPGEAENDASNASPHVDPEHVPSDVSADPASTAVTQAAQADEDGASTSEQTRAQEQEQPAEAKPSEFGDAPVTEADDDVDATATPDASAPASRAPSPSPTATPAEGASSGAAKKKNNKKKKNKKKK